MESMIAFLVGFPFISALLLGLFKNNTMRKIITYISSAAIIFVAVAFAVNYFTNGEAIMLVAENHELFGKEIVELMEYAIVAVECFLVLLVTILSFKYKKYYAAVLSIAQTGLTFWYEFTQKPETPINFLKIDQLTVIMVLIIAIVGTLITVYACGYMNDYHHHHTELKDRRSFFFAIMYIFIGAMFGLVLSNSLLWMYFFWEITSVCSFLLIGYTKTSEAITNCFRALWMNLLGGLGMAIGIVWAGIEFGATDFTALLKHIGEGNVIIVPVICLAFAALTKSAQLPFSKWLLGAMVAPTPSSALLHSATMVKAGVYLLIRLAPVMSGQASGYMIGLIGGLTFLAMSMLAITVSDGKKVLAYSTLSNLGLITACAGIGTEETVWAAMFLVIFHAVSKALLFQTVGSIEHQTGSRDIETMHGLIKRYPYLTLMSVIGIFGMFLAPFGMLISKWAALKAFVDTGLQGGDLLLSIVSVTLVLCICFGSATTLLYWAKWLATILASKPNDVRHKNTLSLNQWVSLGVHSALMVIIAFAFPFISTYVINPYIQQTYAHTSEVISKENIFFTLVMIVLIFLFPIITFLVVRKKPPFKKAERYYNGAGTEDQLHFIDSFGEEKRAFLTNWYMEDTFGETRMYKPSVIVSICLLVIMTIVSLFVGGVF